MPLAIPAGRTDIQFLTIIAPTARKNRVGAPRKTDD